MNSTTTTASRTSPLTSAATPGWAENLVLRAFAEMPRGRLHLQLPGGERREFGCVANPGADPAPGVAAQALLQVHRPDFFRKCVLFGDIGFAESYLDGDWDTPDLTALLGWFLLNHDAAPTLSGSGARTLALNLLRTVNRWGHRLRANTRTTARRNIADHYDLSNDFFRLWLDASMMYSSARFTSDTATLDEAQAGKNDALCRKLRLTAKDHVLEIGTGWGGWSLHAVRHYGCRVTTHTISVQQRDEAVRRIAAAGLADRITVRLQDYREIQGQFDKLVSIEMLEAVGHRYLPDFAGMCARTLKPDGLMALQFITCADHRYAELRRGADFIQKHVFPGSLLLSLNRVNDLLSRRGGFVLHAVEDMGRDYARTLACWRERFLARLPEVQALGFDGRFNRKWLYYLAYCEAAFAMRHISVVQTVHTRPNNLSF